MAITQDTSAPLVVVVGSTGTQGGSVIKALSESDKPYRIRGLTRDTEKPISQGLAKQDVEMVAVDLTVGNKEEVYKAFRGATYAFLVTNFWEHMKIEQEVAEGMMLVDAAKAANVKLLIWSGLEDCTGISGGKYPLVDHFDGKAKVTRYAKQIGVPFANVEAGFYMTNLTWLLPPKKQEDGTYAIMGPAAGESTAPLIDTASDYGLFVREVIERPEIEPMTEVFTYGEIISYNDMAKQLGEIQGKKVTYVQVSEDQHIANEKAAGFPERIGQELCQMYLFIEEFGYYGGKGLASHEHLVKKPHTWSDFVKAADWSKILS